MAEEEKTNGPDEEVTPADDEEVVNETIDSTDDSEENSDDDSVAESAPVRKKDRSKIHLDSDQTKAKKKKKEPGKVRRWFKDFFSELKKVTWPTFPKVLRQTGTVLLVAVVFLVVLMGFDALFKFLYELLLENTGEAVAVAVSMLKGGGGLL